MNAFNLADYETVEDRLKRFWAMPEHTDARIITINHTTEGDRQRSQWVVEARIYLSQAEQLANTPKAAEWAFETDGVGMANKTSALENCCTSAIGRALADMNMSGNKRTSREEMEKVARGPARNWMAEAEKLAAAEELDKLRMLYNEAKQNKAPEAILDGIKELGQSRTQDSGSESGGVTGTDRGTPNQETTKPNTPSKANGIQKSRKA
jgi:hypothetical protein